MSTYTGPRRHANDPDRRKWQHPEAILAAIGLGPGMTFVDVGCGGGFFALPAAGIFGDRGTVYSVDADAQSIAEMQDMAAEENLRTPRSEAHRPGPCVCCHRRRSPPLASPERIAQTAADLKEMGIQKIGVSHCTGFPASLRLAEEFAEAFFLNNAGTRITLQ